MLTSHEVKASAGVRKVPATTRRRAWNRVALLATMVLIFAAHAIPAHAVDLPFSPDCRNFQQIVVAPPNNAILFAKQPVPHPNGSATVFNINSAENIVIPAGRNSCIVAAPDPGSSYCFLARSDNTIDRVGGSAIQNPGGLPACQ